MNASVIKQPHIADRSQLSGVYGHFRDNHCLKVILFMGLMVSAMLAIFVVLAHQVTPTETLTDPLHKATLLLNVTHVTGVIVNLACLPIYWIWLNRSGKNAWLLNPPKMKTTPGRTVGNYFIPIISLWKPYTNMMEIRNASFGMRNDLRHLIPIWWLSWLSLLALQIARLLGRLTNNPEIMIMGDKLSTVSATTNIILNYLSMIVILSITNAQSKRAAELQR
ncbi:MAG: DUF4328 domain-containing protein [Akkermansiaceae bacterium]